MAQTFHNMVRKKYRRSRRRQTHSGIRGLFRRVHSEAGAEECDGIESTSRASRTRGPYRFFLVVVIASILFFPGALYAPVSDFYWWNLELTEVQNEPEVHLDENVVCTVGCPLITPENAP